MKREEKGTRKFMQTLDNRPYGRITRLAKERGITVQDMIRAVIVPEWFTDFKNGLKTRVKKRGSTKAVYYP